VASEQDSVQVCEEVIAESLPRFLGIVGGRYGWIPDRDNPEGISITEREIQMALEHRSARPVFLMREPAVPHGLSDPDSLTDADDPEHFLHKQARLSELIQHIHASKSDIHSYQAACIDGKLSLELDFEETAYSALLSSLEHDPDLAPWFDLTDSDNEVSFVEAAQAFAYDRTHGFNASLRSREIADLDAASKTDGYILLTGGGGLGKTSLVAQAYLTASEVGDRKVVGAFVGGMQGTGSSHELLTNLVRSLSDDPPEAEMTKLAEQFLSALHTAKPLMFLDGLDQLSDAGRLSWLPYGLPVGTTVVLSTMDDTVAQPFRDRGAAEVRVDALSLTDARTVLLGHLHRYRKVLEPRQVDALLSKADATSPLYLACVAEELRTLGVREELDKHIAAMPPDVGGLFLWVLRRLETDRQFRWEDGATKVRRLLSCLGVSRDGLSESELCGLVDDASGDVAVLIRLLRPYLSRRGDLLSLHHRAHGEALRGIGIGNESRRLLGDDHPGYLDEESEIDAAREVLATYFDGTESNVVSERQAYEWPHQLFHLKAWERLERCLLQRAVFERLAVDSTKWELTSYWHPLREAPISRDMAALYSEAFEQWRTWDELEDADIVTKLALFLWDNGLYDSAEPLCRYTFDIRERILGLEHPDTLSILNTIANVLLDKGDLEGAEFQYRILSDIRERVLGSEHSDTLGSFYNLAMMLVEKDNFAEAEVLYRRVLDVQVRVFGPEHPDTLHTVHGMAILLSAKGDHLGAGVLCRRAMEAFERILGPQHPHTLSSINNLAVINKDCGDLVGAEHLHEKVLEARLRILGPEHPDTLSSMNNLSILLKDRGELSKAEELVRRTLLIRERVLGLEHPDTVRTISDLAILLKEIGLLERAESLLRRVLETFERVRGPEHSLTLSSVNSLANLLSDKGDLVNAEQLYRRALETRERILGPEHPHSLNSLSNLANLLKRKGNLAEAESLYRKALETREHILGSEHPDTLSSVNSMANLLSDRGDLAGAEPLYRHVLETRDRILGTEHPDSLGSLSNLANLVKRQGNLTEAESLYRKALETRERILGPEHPDTLSSVNSMANLLSERGDLAGAEPLYRHALETRERILGPEHPDSLGSLSNLANLLKRQGYLTEAEPLYRKAHETFERVLGPEHPHTLRSLSNLANLIQFKGDLFGTEPLRRRALAAFERVLGPEHPDTLSSVNNLAILLSDMGDLAEAEPLYSRAMEGRKRTLGPEHPATRSSANALNGFLEARAIVESIKGRMDCNRCLGTGFVAHADIIRLVMHPAWRPGPCQLCREAAGL
jgi:tetratricopeptide (TPR) repeat protein